MCQKAEVSTIATASSANTPRNFSQAACHGRADQTNNKERDLALAVGTEGECFRKCCKGFDFFLFILAVGKLGSLNICCNILFVDGHLGARVFCWCVLVTRLVQFQNIMLHNHVTPPTIFLFTGVRFIYDSSFGGFVGTYRGLHRNSRKVQEQKLELE